MTPVPRLPSGSFDTIIQLGEKSSALRSRMENGLGDKKTKDEKEERFREKGEMGERARSMEGLDARPLPRDSPLISSCYRRFGRAETSELCHGFLRISHMDEVANSSPSFPHGKAFACAANH